MTNRRLRTILDHLLIGLVIVLGTSAVSAMSRLDQLNPGVTIYERLMLLVPCGQ